MLLPLLGSIVYGFLLVWGLDLLGCDSLLTLLSFFIITLAPVLEGLTELLDLHLNYTYSKLPLTGSDEGSLFDLPSVSGINCLDEKNLLENGVADSEGARNRDNAISNGLDTNVSYQPYARDLANKLQQDRDGSSHIPSTILSRDQDFIKSVAPNCWDNYNPNRHYLNSRVMRAYLRSLQ